MDRMRELVNENILDRIAIAGEIEQVFFAAGTNAAAEAAGPAIPIVLGLHVALLGHVGGHFVRRHHDKANLCLIIACRMSSRFASIWSIR